MPGARFPFSVLEVKALCDQVCVRGPWVHAPPLPGIVQAPPHPPPPPAPAPPPPPYTPTHLPCQARAIFMSEPSLITTRAPIKVFGDIHGQYSDLLSFFLVHGAPYPPGRSDIQGFRCVAGFSTPFCRLAGAFPFGHRSAHPGPGLRSSTCLLFNPRVVTRVRTPPPQLTNVPFSRALQVPVQRRLR